MVSMAVRHPPSGASLLGVGLYTVRQAQDLLGVPATRLTRWLRGYAADGREHDPLWRSQVEIGDGRTYLGFRDLVQARMTAALVGTGLSPQTVRAAIATAADILETSHPLADARFRTDGRTILLDTLTAGIDDRLIDLFKGQFVMRVVIEPSLKDIDFDDDVAARWWPAGRDAGIVLDPARQFGRPIDDVTGVPTSILAAAVQAEGSQAAAAAAYGVPVGTIRRALSFEVRANAASRRAA